jgi:hypothetical protein
MVRYCLISLVFAFLVSCKQPVEIQSPEEMDSSNGSFAVKVKPVEQFGSFIVMNEKNMVDTAFLYLFSNNLNGAREELLKTGIGQTAESLVVVGEYLFRRAEMTREIIDQTAAVMRERHKMEMSQNGIARSSAGQKVSWEIAEAYLHLNQPDIGQALIVSELMRELSDDATNAFYQQLLETIDQMPETNNTQQILYKYFTVGWKDVYELYPELSEHYIYLEILLGQTDADLEKYMKKRFPRRLFSQIDDPVSWFPLMRLQVLADFHVAGIAFERLVGEMDLIPAVKNIATLKSGLAFLNALHNDYAAEMLSRSQTSLAQWCLSGMKKNKDDMRIFDLQYKHIDLKRLILEDCFYRESFGLCNAEEHTPIIRSLLDLDSSGLDPVSSELWLYYRQRLMSVLLKSGVSLDVFNILSEFSESTIIHVQDHDLLFLLRYAGTLFDEGYSGYNDFIGLIGNICNQIIACDTLKHNFRVLNAGVSRGSGRGAYIR